MILVRNYYNSGISENIFSAQFYLEGYEDLNDEAGYIDIHEIEVRKTHFFCFILKPFFIFLYDNLGDEDAAMGGGLDDYEMELDDDDAEYEIDYPGLDMHIDDTELMI